MNEAKKRLPLPTLLAKLGVKTPSKDKFNIPCPIHGEQNGKSFSVTLKSGGQYLWKCYGKCNCGGDEITFLEKFEQLSRPDAMKRHKELAGVNTAKKPKRKSKSAFYNELDFSPLSQDIARKITNWRGYKLETVQWLSDHGYIGLNHGHIAIPIYDELGEVIRAQTRLENGEWKYLPLNEAPITPLVIGNMRTEKVINAFESPWDCFALIDKLPMPEAVGCAVVSRGAANGGKVGHLIPEGATCFAWMQNDTAAEQWLVAINKSTPVQIRRVLIRPEHKDLNDWCRAGATKQDLIDALRKSCVVEKPKLPELATLLSGIIAVLKQYVSFASEHQVVVIALWIAHAHCFEQFNCTGYLHICSPIKRCGKSKLLECIAMLVPRAWLAINPSDAVLFRKIERECPTLLLDEADRSFADGENGNHDLLAILNAGYTRGATVDRCGGANRDKLESFHVFCPKAFAGIGKLPDTTQDRCFPIRLERQRARASKRLRRAHAEMEMFPLRDQLADWGQSETAKHKLSVELLPSALPDSLSDRAADVCEPLYKVGIAAGGDWYERAVKASTAIFGSEEDENKATAQLAAVRDAFGDDARLSTSDLIDRLLEQDDSPFPNWWCKKDVDKKSIGKSLARIFKPFNVKVSQMRIEGEKVKGYERADLESVWERYCGKQSISDNLEGPEVPGEAIDSLPPTYVGTSNIAEAGDGTSGDPF